MTFQENLQRLREEYMLSPSALATKAGLSKSMGWRYETGGEIPRLDRALAIIKATPESFNYEWEVDGCTITVKKK